MEEEIEVTRDGDPVRPRGAAGPIMLVESQALGDEHDWEGVRNGVYCTWADESGPRYEVYRAGQLVVVKRAGAVSGNPP